MACCRDGGSICGTTDEARAERDVDERDHEPRHEHGCDDGRRVGHPGHRRRHGRPENAPSPHDGAPSGTPGSGSGGRRAVQGHEESPAAHVSHDPYLGDADLGALDAWWRAANYLSVGQIYLMDNPLLRVPLAPEHVKPRLLGHWGTTPGLNFVHAHLNRTVLERDLDMIYIYGPGHGGPGAVASAWLDGRYSEVYPQVPQDEHGMKRLFTQFSFPGGIPSHVAPETPGSIHEGGELGYALSHAFGAAFDNPDLVVACVIGDGEAETGPLATSWHSNKFLDPVGDGAVLPILHLNGYKIANPTVLGADPGQRARRPPHRLRLGAGHRRRATSRRACTTRSAGRSTAAST